MSASITTRRAEANWASRRWVLSSRNTSSISQRAVGGGDLGGREDRHRHVRDVRGARARRRGGRRPRVWVPETPAGEFRKLLPVELMPPPRSDRQARGAWS